MADAGVVVSGLITDLMAAAESGGGATDYIVHHETFLSNKVPHGIVDFSTLNLDTVFFSLVLALLFGGAFYLAARDHRGAGQVSAVRRSAGRFRRQAGQGHLPRHEQAHRPARPHHLLLDPAVQPHGSGAGRP